MGLCKKLQTTVFDLLVCEILQGEVFDLAHAQPLKRVRSTRNPFAKHPVVILADPFLFVHQGRLFLFYEEQVDLRGKGVLKMTSTADLQHWSEEQVVLEEPFHLSYPNVFAYQGEVYMMPETGHNRDIRLYKALDDSLTQWRYSRSLLEGKNYVDSTLIEREEGVYLLTSEYEGGRAYTLRLFYAQEPLQGAWRECACSPLSAENKKARCGGPIIAFQGREYRMAQRCDGGYGGGLEAYELTALSQTCYEERHHAVVLPAAGNHLQQGGHHYSMVQFQGKTIVAVDYLSTTYNLREMGRRVTQKLRRK